MRPGKLDDTQVQRALATLPGWTLEAGHLRREFEFTDFVEAWGFMSSMALVSEAMNHHPDWSNVYRRVVIELSTHDAGGVTDLDLEWARRAERALRTAAQG